MICTGVEESTVIELDYWACRRMIAAGLLQAILDAQKGDPEATQWLAGPYAVILAEALDIRLRMDRLSPQVTSILDVERVARERAVDLVDAQLRKNPDATANELAFLIGINRFLAGDCVRQLRE
jgi:hypothetical protein